VGRNASGEALIGRGTRDRPDRQGAVIRGADRELAERPEPAPGCEARARRVGVLWGAKLLFFIYFKMVLFTWSSYTPANSLRSCGADAASDL
jgi:hypothetical protein